MVVYSCGCLNVRIYAEKIEAKSKSDVFQACPLGPSCEAVELVDQGFQFGHKCLVQRISDGDWTVYACVPCHLQTHAVNRAARLVAVNAAMKKGEEVIQQIKDNPDYSQVFGLLLSSADGPQKNDVAFQAQSYETLQKQLCELQDVLSRYLKQEEDAMETRIRNYEEEQRNNFSKLKERAQNEKAKLISVLFHCSEGNKNLQSQERGPTRTHAPLIHSKSATEHGKASNFHRNVKKNWKIRDSSPDVFAMDELDIDEVDEETNGATFSNRSENTKWSENNNNSHVQQYGRKQAPGLDSTDEAAAGQEDAPSLLSTSVPISMPAHARNVRVSADLDDSFEEAAEFDDIPRNMQALSESIQERDRYIFGDRPRQRVHTGDFTQVNWH